MIDVYFDNGVQVIWLVDPFRQTVSIYRADADHDKPDVLKNDQALTAEDLLPGFSLPLSDLFNL
jgi:Uma2 family endonuclease